MAVTFLDATTTGNTAFASSRAVPVPTGGGALQADDVVVVRLSRWESINPAVTVPGGGTWVHRTQQANGSGKIDTYLKRLTASDSGTYTFSWTGSMWTTGQGCAYRGVDPAADLSTIPLHQVTNSGTAWPAATLNSVSDGVLDWHGYSESGGTHTVPTTPAFTEVEDNDSDVHGYFIATAASYTTSGGASSVSSPNIVSMLHLPAASGGGPTTHDLAASGSGTAAGSAALLLRMATSAAGSGTPGGSGVLSLLIPISGSGTGTSTGSAVLSLRYPLTATGAATATGSAALSSRLTLSANGAATAGGTADLTLSGAGPTTHQLTAAGSGTASGTAVLRLALAASATGAAVSTGTAALTARLILSAAGSATSIGSAYLTALWVLTAAGSATSGGSAALDVVGPLPPITERPFAGLTTRPTGAPPATLRPDAGVTPRP